MVTPLGTRLILKAFLHLIVKYQSSVGVFNFIDRIRNKRIHFKLWQARWTRWSLLRSAWLSWERTILCSIPRESQTPTQVPLTTNKAQPWKLLFLPLSGFLSECKRKTCYFYFFWLPRAANAWAVKHDPYYTPAGRLHSDTALSSTVKPASQSPSRQSKHEAGLAGWVWIPALGCLAASPAEESDRQLPVCQLWL